MDANLCETCSKAARQIGYRVGNAAAKIPFTWYICKLHIQPKDGGCYFTHCSEYEVTTWPADEAK